MENNSNPPPNKENIELLKVILLSLLWLIFFALSFITYYTIPAVIFITWAIIAWIIRASKGDKDDGSGYDHDF